MTLFFALLTVYLTIHVPAIAFTSILGSGSFLTFRNCYSYRGEPPLLNDCLIAIDNIPNGRLEYNGDTPPSFSLPKFPGKIKLLPASFRYRSCAINVVSNIRNPRIPERPDRWMYYHVWPAARDAAKFTVHSCLLYNKLAGESNITVQAGGSALDLKIMFRHPARDPFLQRRVRYHIYDAASNATEVSPWRKSQSQSSLGSLTIEDCN
jgi:hypothetical protein